MEITSVCPYCGKEMRDGAIPVLRDIYWCPRGEDGMLKDLSLIHISEPTRP